MGSDQEGMRRQGSVDRQRNGSSGGGSSSGNKLLKGRIGNHTVTVALTVRQWKIVTNAVHVGVVAINFNEPPLRHDVGLRNLAALQ